MQPVTLQSARVALTPPRDSDIDHITEYCRDPLFERFLTTPWPYERAHAEYFVGEYAAGGWHRGDEATWAIRETPDGPLLGAIGVRMPRGSVGFWLGAPHRARGLMTEAFALAAAFAFSADGLALERLRWEAAVGNTASAALARSVGFRYDGEGPGEVPGRDGQPVLSWLASMGPEDRGTRAEGWPL